MANISSSDSLYVCASSMGRQFYNFTGEGIDSLSEIIDLVRNTPGAPQGLVMLTVRNASKGWCQNRTFYIA